MDAALDSIVKEEISLAWDFPTSVSASPVGKACGSISPKIQGQGQTTFVRKLD
jgi:hypothetical protein